MLCSSATLGCTRSQSTPESSGSFLLEDGRYLLLSEAQRLALDKLTALVGIEQINYIMVQGPDELQARFDAFAMRLHLLAKFMTM